MYINSFKTHRNPYEMGPLFVRILQVKKPRPREVKKLAQHCTAHNSEPGSELWESVSRVQTLNYDSVLPLGKYPRGLYWAFSVFQAVRSYG